MSKAKLSRERKRQLGQFLTPPSVAKEIVRKLPISPEQRVLEPSLGNGAFVFALLDAFRDSLAPKELYLWTHRNLYGCEIDAKMMHRFSVEWYGRNMRALPRNIVFEDFFRWLPPSCDRSAATDRHLYFNSPLEFFDLIIGNPPFGGSIDPLIQDELDHIFGTRNGMKIKKETYAFFLVKCLDMLKPDGRLCFICSDTILTIPSMRGLRHHLQTHCDIEIEPVPGNFEGTNQGLVLITLIKRSRKPNHIWVMGDCALMADIEKTKNLSWGMSSKYARYFYGRTLGDFMVASSGMTTGNNALFLREIAHGAIEEPYEFSYAQEPVTLEGEVGRARLGKLSDSQIAAIREREKNGDMRRVIRWKQREKPLTVRVPHEDYCYYNKATSGVIYDDPRWAIFWRDNGAYVYTYKKTGKWYLRGIGGKAYFERAGLTWSLIAPRLYTRWLPPGYIFDSGSPCAFLKPDIDYDELPFILGWTLTDLCTKILKNVINHTRNIQSKDFERLPYPDWVSPDNKRRAIAFVNNLMCRAMNGERFDVHHSCIRKLEEFYACA